MKKLNKKAIALASSLVLGGSVITAAVAQSCNTSTPEPGVPAPTGVTNFINNYLFGTSNPPRNTSFTIPSSNVRNFSFAWAAATYDNGATFAGTFEQYLGNVSANDITVEIGDGVYTATQSQEIITINGVNREVTAIRFVIPSIRVVSSFNSVYNLTNSSFNLTNLSNAVFFGAPLVGNGPNSYQFYIRSLGEADSFGWEGQDDISFFIPRATSSEIQGFINGLLEKTDAFASPDNVISSRPSTSTSPYQAVLWDSMRDHYLHRLIFAVDPLTGAVTSVGASLSFDLNDTHNISNTTLINESGTTINPQGTFITLPLQTRITVRFQFAISNQPAEYNDIQTTINPVTESPYQYNLGNLYVTFIWVRENINSNWVSPLISNGNDLNWITDVSFFNPNGVVDIGPNAD